MSTSESQSPRTSDHEVSSQCVTPARHKDEGKAGLCGTICGRGGVIVTDNPCSVKGVIPTVSRSDRKSRDSNGTLAAPVIVGGVL